MLKYTIQRIITFIPMLIAISLLSFIISINAPGDPVERLAKSSESEGSAQEQSGASKKIKAELRKKLGLDLPIFYISISDFASSDTLYKIQDKYHKANLEALTHQSGNWQVVSNYYNKLLNLQKTHQKINAKNIVANNILLDLNEVNEITNRFGSEIGSLLETSNKELVALKFEKMNTLMTNYSYLNSLKPALSEAEKYKNDLSEKSTRWKTYIPTLHWYGTKTNTIYGCSVMEMIEKVY